MIQLKNEGDKMKSNVKKYEKRYNAELTSLREVYADLEKCGIQEAKNITQDGKELVVKVM